jgi:hypothetical protein
LIRQPNGEEMFLRSGLCTSQDPDIPTWLQDFAQAKQSLFDISVLESTYKAAGPGDFKVSIYNESLNIINLNGYMVDEVVDVTVVNTLEEADGLIRITEYVAASMWTINRAKDRSRNACPSELDTVQAPVMAMCANTYEAATWDLLVIGFWLLGMYSCLPEESRSWERAIQDLETLPWYPASTTPQRLQEAVEKFELEIIFPILQELRLATTKDGYFANLPSVTVPGDEVWIIQGCRLPVVLRKSQVHPGAFRLVGSCYCLGVMEGEVLQREGFCFTEIQIH